MSSEQPEVAERPRVEEPVRDGIGEEDNPIPLWFNVTFYGAIVFGIVYILYYDFSGWSQATQYAAEVERVSKETAAARPATPVVTYPASLSANVKTAIPSPMRYTANGTNPRLRTQAMNHATEA